MGKDNPFFVVLKLDKSDKPLSGFLLSAFNAVFLMVDIERRTAVPLQNPLFYPLVEMLGRAGELIIFIAVVRVVLSEDDMNDVVVMLLIILFIVLFRDDIIGGGDNIFKILDHFPVIQDSFKGDDSSHEKTSPGDSLFIFRCLEKIYHNLLQVNDYVRGKR